MRAIDHNGHVPQPGQMTETRLCKEIESYCDSLGLAYHHNPDSRRVHGKPGFPDYVIAGPHGVLYREAKDERNSLGPDQRVWGRLLEACGADWGTWRPRDLFSRRILYELQELTEEYRAA